MKENSQNATERRILVTAAKLKKGDIISIKGEEKELGRVRRIYPKAGTGKYQFTVDAEVVGEKDHLYLDHEASVLLVERRSAND